MKLEIQITSLRRNSVSWFQKAETMRNIVTLCVLIVGCGLVATDDEVYASGRIRSAGNKEVRAANCASKYKKLGEQTGKTHTMCQYTKVARGKVKKPDIKKIVDKHNRLRANPYSHGTARAMLKVYWDKNIEEIAQYYANTCPTGHDELRDVPGYHGLTTEQNLAWNASSWDDAIQGWFDTRIHFNHVNHRQHHIVPGSHKPFSRIVQDTMSRIGCGYAQCGNTKTYVCNYAAPQFNYGNPIEVGPTCGGCPRTIFFQRCSGKKCDAQGKVCYNGGTLHLNTLECTCPSLYYGRRCNKIDCGSSDPSSCPQNQQELIFRDPGFCKSYENTQKCPVICKACENYIETPKAKLRGGSG